MIEIKNLSKYYSNNGITTLGLRDINLSFEKNEIVGIVGESGSGKSTLLNVISGMDSYDDGEIYFNGEETSYFDERDRDEFRKRNVAFINQNYNIIDSYSVLENVTLPLLINGMKESLAIERAKELIEKVHLSHRIKSKGSQLSGGEKQRCVIARALAKDTPILACDEPTGNLDSKSGEDIINLLKEVSKDKLVLIVTHNEEQANSILTRKIRIHDGQVTEDIPMRSFEKSEESEQVPVAENKKNDHALRRSMAWKNIKGTPKKNIFTSLVFIAFSFGMMFFYLLSSSYGNEASFLSSSNFLNLARERIIVYRDDHQALDESKLDSIKGTKYKNAFYEDKTAYLIEETDSGYFYGDNVSMTYQMPKNATITKAEAVVDPSLINVTIVQNNKGYYSFSDGEVGKNKILAKDYSDNSQILGKVHISKIASCDDLNRPIIVFENTVDVSFLNKILTKELQVTTVTLEDGTTYTSEKSNVITSSAGETINGQSGPKKNTLYHVGKTSLAKPKSVKGVIGELYETTITDYEYKEELNDFYADDYDQFIFMCSSAQTPEECYEMTIYADNVDDAAKKIKAAGYQYIIPSKASSANSRMMNVKTIITTMLYVQVTAVGFFLSFAVYGILSRIYVTKTKDFTIFRSLGVLKKDLRAILEIEVNAIAFVSSLISIIALVILGSTTQYFGNLMAVANPFMFIFFVVVLQLLAMFIANRFNKLLFKLTITDSLKEERR